MMSPQARIVRIVDIGAPLNAPHDVARRKARQIIFVCMFADRACAIAPILWAALGRPSSLSSSRSLFEGSGAPADAGVLRNPRWMAGEAIRWDALRRRPLAPFGTRRLPALHVRRSIDVRAALPRTWTSHACQPAPGGRSYCLRAEPRHRPGVKGYVRPDPR